MANESCCPLKFSIQADKKDPVYGKRICSIILLCPLLQGNNKTRQKKIDKGQYTIKFQLSALLQFPLPLKILKEEQTTT